MLLIEGSALIWCWHVTGWYMLSVWGYSLMIDASTFKLKTVL